MVRSSAISLYFHIPFCSRKCPYCHFFVLKEDQEKKAFFLPALKKEWQAKLPLLKNKKIISIYFGGGTPSKLAKEELKEIFSWFDFLEEKIEISFEMNPEDSNLEYLRHLKELGVNRLSIGIQSFDDDLLKFLRRTHNAEQGAKAVDLALQAGFDNISLDLLYDLPNQTFTSFVSTLDTVSHLPIHHISLYNLVLERPSVFYRQRKKITPLLPQEKKSLQMLKHALQFFTENGFTRYEISAFAKENKFSVHNTGYWTGRPFLGYGPSAFSYWENTRIKNIANLKVYHTLLQENKDPIEFSETLPMEQRQKELFAVQLRLTKGVNLQTFTKAQGSLGSSLIQNLTNLIKEGFIQKKGNQVSLTEKGKLFYDSVGEKLI